MPKIKNWTKELLISLSKITTSEKKKLEMALWIYIVHLGWDISTFKKVFPWYEEFLDIVKTKKVSLKTKKEIETAKNDMIISSMNDFLHNYNDLVFHTTGEFPFWQYFTRESIIDLMCSIVNKNDKFKNKKKITIYDPSSWVWMMLVQGYLYFKENYPDIEINLIWQEFDEKLIEINKFLFSIFWIEESEFKLYQGDTIYKSWVLKNNDSIDLILSNPPFWNKSIDLEKFKRYYPYSPVYELNDLQYHFLYHIIHIMLNQECPAMVITTNNILESLQNNEWMFLRYMKLFSNWVFKQKLNMFRGTSVWTLIWHLEERNHLKEIDVSDKGDFIKNFYWYSKNNITEIVDNYNIEVQERIENVVDENYIQGSDFLTPIPLNKKKKFKEGELSIEWEFPVIYPNKKEFISWYVNDFKELVVNLENKEVLIMNDYSPSKIYQYNQPYIQFGDNVRSFIFNNTKGVSIENVVKQIKEYKTVWFKRYTSTILGMKFKKDTIE